MAAMPGGSVPARRSCPGSTATTRLSSRLQNRSCRHSNGDDTRRRNDCGGHFHAVHMANDLAIGLIRDRGKTRRAIIRAAVRDDHDCDVRMGPHRLVSSYLHRHPSPSPGQAHRRTWPTRGPRGGSPGCVSAAEATGYARPEPDQITS